MKQRVNRSAIWSTPTEELKTMLSQCVSLSEVLRRLGFASVTGSTYKSLKHRLESEKIDCSHILGKSSNRGKSFKGKGQFPLEQVMVENSTYCRKDLKKRLLRDGLLDNKCAICGQEPEWIGKTLVLVLDHINGINNDHRRHNLRLLCPNCNSQQDTFAGKRRQN